MTSTPEVIQARRTESLDAPEILKLVSTTTEKLFGRVNVVNIMWVNSTFDSFVRQVWSKMKRIGKFENTREMFSVALLANNWHLTVLYDTFGLT